MTRSRSWGRCMVAILIHHACSIKYMQADEREHSHAREEAICTMMSLPAKCRVLRIDQRSKVSSRTASLPRPWSQQPTFVISLSPTLSVADPRHIRLSQQQLLEHRDIRHFTPYHCVYERYCSLSTHLCTLLYVRFTPMHTCKCVHAADTNPSNPRHTCVCYVQ